MSKSNPRKAVSAILPPGVARINPMTLGVYAALERIKSPLVTGVEAKDTLEIIPSLYLLTHDPREVFRGNVVELAMAWAAEQPLTAVEEILAAAKRQMDALFDVIPEGTQKNGGDDGWIAATIDWAARAYGWGFNEILWDVPASALFLLKRQEWRDERGRFTCFPLSEIEKIDDGQEA